MWRITKLLVLSVALWTSGAVLQAQPGYCYSNYVYGYPTSCQIGASGTTTGVAGNMLGCMTGFLCTDSLYPDLCLTDLRYVTMAVSWTCPNTPATVGYAETYALGGDSYGEGYASIWGPGFFDIAYGYRYCNGSFSGSDFLSNQDGC